MSLWIVTIGSSDVQLDSDRVNRDKGRTEKQRSDKVWRDWYDDTIKPECCDIPFEPKPAFKDSEESYRIPPRVLGVVYKSSSEEVKEEIRNYLTFPLLNNFVNELKKLEPPEAIAILLTDQSEIFKDDYKRRKPKCAYWQDTCELEGILNRYLKQEFPGAEIVPLILSPQEEPGLDDWDRVLNFVRDKLDELDKLSLQPDTVYVSHQAGTPAISSAVQFSSLAKFRTNVKFLVSNEYSQETRPISRSNYLGAIQRQEAQALLKNHDYAAVQSLLNDYLDSETKILLDAAIQWNYAKFGDFANEMQKLSDRALVERVNERSQHWWWTAYEAAYLGIIRLKQGNTVEAFFHSYRAVEGAFLEWGKQEFKTHIEIINDRAYLQPSILHDPKNYFNGAKIYPDNPKKNNSLGELKLSFEALANKQENPEKNQQKPKGELLYGTTLYRLFETQKPNCKNMVEYKRFLAGDGIGEKRNKNFHQLQGLTASDVYRDWEVDNLEQWEKKILTYLNLITKDDLAQEKEFISLENASLMAQVHQKLKEAIDSYKPG